MSETEPSLELYRPVRNIDRASCDDLIIAALANGIPPDKFSLYLNPESDVSLVTHRQVRRLHHMLGIVPNKKDCIDLSEYLGEVLPESFDEPLGVPMLPLTMFKQSGKGARRLLTVATNHPTLIAEKAAARAAINAYYGIGGTATVKPPEAWPEQEYHGSVWVARVRSPELAEQLGRLLEREFATLLPIELSLGEAAIEIA